jgi:hypothetical protein
MYYISTDVIHDQKKNIMNGEMKAWSMVVMLCKNEGTGI